VDQQRIAAGLIEGWRMPDKPEQKARRETDADLKAAGWIVQNLEDLEVTAGRGIADGGPPCALSAFVFIGFFAVFDS
jgi:hypothetical protein